MAIRFRLKSLIMNAINTREKTMLVHEHDRDIYIRCVRVHNK